MPKKEDDLLKHTRFISVVPLERPGVIEFGAWEKAKWLGVWLKPFNVKTTMPHLVFLDCPTTRQIIFRLLILEGQAPLPVDPNEDWTPFGIPAWQTRRSFGTGRGTEARLAEGDDD
jgi:hypothetical protein